MTFGNNETEKYDVKNDVAPKNHTFKYFKKVLINGLDYLSTDDI